ncbi:hypothetical protein L208DRAFT_1415087 [Tricholoma matsutake]|nr:hypothetical protein L208DRAFT_1415087 [Tricholoma matsutake 945]
MSFTRPGLYHKHTLYLVSSSCQNHHRHLPSFPFLPLANLPIDMKFKRLLARLFRGRRMKRQVTALPPEVEPNPEVEEPDAEVEEPDTEVEEPDTEVEEPDTEVEEPDTEVEEPDTEVACSTDPHAMIIHSSSVCR